MNNFWVSMAFAVMFELLAQPGVLLQYERALLKLYKVLGQVLRMDQTRVDVSQPSLIKPIG